MNTTQKTMHTTNGRLMIGAILLIAGFMALTTLAGFWFALFLAGMVAWAITFGKETRQVFTAPRKLWLIPTGVIVYFIISILVGIVIRFTPFEWAASPFSGQLGQIIWMLPFMLMGEELVGIGVLEVARSKGLSIVSSSLLSALIFGLMHVSTYWDGSIVSTLLHVLLLQSVARLIFNYVYLKTGRSIWASWMTHLLVDLIALSFAAEFGTFIIK